MALLEVKLHKLLLTNFCTIVSEKIKIYIFKHETADSFGSGFLNTNLFGQEKMNRNIVSKAKSDKLEASLKSANNLNKLEKKKEKMRKEKLARRSLKSTMKPALNKFKKIAKRNKKQDSNLILNINHDSVKVSIYCENAFQTDKPNVNAEETTNEPHAQISEFENSIICDDNLMLLIQGSN